MAQIEGKTLGKKWKGIDGFLRAELDRLNAYAHNGQVPEQDLLKDIAAYEYALSTPERIDAYWKLRDEFEPGIFSPGEVHQVMLKRGL